MTLISWQDKYSVGVDAFDRDHRILVDLINQLHDAYAAGHGDEALKPALDLLLAYTDKHFHREEALMVEYGYPERGHHHEEHEELKGQVQAFADALEAGRTEGLMLEMLGFLNNWLRLHILEEDMQYKAFFQEKGVNQAPIDDMSLEE